MKLELNRDYNVDVFMIFQGKKIVCQEPTCFYNPDASNYYVIVESPFVEDLVSKVILIPLIFDPSLALQTASYVTDEQERAAIDDVVRKENCTLMFEPDSDIVFEVKTTEMDDFERKLAELSSVFGSRPPFSELNAVKEDLGRRIVEDARDSYIEELCDSNSEDNNENIMHGLILALLKSGVALEDFPIDITASASEIAKAKLSPDDYALSNAFGQLIKALGKAKIVNQDVINALSGLVECSLCDRHLYYAILNHKSYSKALSRGNRQEIQFSVISMHADFFEADEVKAAANYYYQKEEHESAVSLFKVLEERQIGNLEDPKELAETYNSIGCCYVDLLQFEKAYASFSQAKKADREYAAVYNNWAYTLATESETTTNKPKQQKILRDALALINDAIQKNPNDVSYITNRAYIEYELGDYNRVLEDFERAKELSQKYEDYSTCLKLSIDSKIKLAIEERSRKSDVFSKVQGDLQTIYSNESSQSKYYFEALRVQKDAKGFESEEQLEEISNSLLLLEFYASELLDSITIHDPQQDIYFYSSMRSLQLILSDDKESPRYRVPLFNVNHMNDPREGREFENAIKKRVDSSPMFDALFCHNSEDNSCRRRLETDFVFLKSFTKNDDSLPMWVHYADSGKGCCVKVSRNFFSNFTSDLTGDERTFTSNPFDNTYRLRSIMYLKDGKLMSPSSSVVENNYNEFLYYFTKVNDIYENLNEKTQLLVLDALKTITRELKYLFKTYDYVYEQEMRIVVWRPISAFKRDDLDIRTTPSTVEKPIPKVFVYTTKSISIDEIILGPKVGETDDIVPFFEKKLLELNNNALDRVLITKSDIEYR